MNPADLSQIKAARDIAREEPLINALRVIASNSLDPWAASLALTTVEAWEKETQQNPA